MTPTRTEFEEELAALHNEVTRMAQMTNTAIKQAMQALQTRDEDLARYVINNDRQINALRYQIETNALTTIARQQPVARDLRFIIAVITIVLDLERMADHAAGIAKVAIEMGKEPPLKPLIDLPRMASIAQEMLTDSIQAFNTVDTEKAKIIITRDDEVDQLYEQVFRELVSYMIEDPHTVTRAMYLLFIGHNLERVADRVTNICERVIFQAEGKIEETPGSASAISLT